MTCKEKIIMLICLIISGISVYASTGNVETSEKINQPNIIYILADDLGYGDVSCYNENSKIKTPFIDQLAADGVRFTDAHTSSSVCTPTRYGILTGRYNWRSHLKKGVLNGYSKPLISNNRKTIAEFLKEHGYRTACIGKWHLGWEWNNIHKHKDSVDFSKPIKNGPTTLGFDYFFGFCGSLDMPPYVYVENDMPTMIPSKMFEGMKDYKMARPGLISEDFGSHVEVLPELTRRSVEYIEQTKTGQPFFLYFPLPAPHTPIVPTEEFQGKSGIESPYADFVIMVDWVVEEIMNAVKNKGVEENTIIVFTSDNGCSPKANFKYLKSKGHNPSHVFRGQKSDIFEGGHRVPFIVKWPAKAKSAVSEQLISTTDMFATVAEIIGENYGDEVAEDSYSFLSSLTNVNTNAPLRMDIIHSSINGSFSIRKGDWKLILCPDSGGWSYPNRKTDKEYVGTLPEFQLYNLRYDSGEENNMYEKETEIVKGLFNLIKKQIEEGRSTPGLSQRNDGEYPWKQLDWME